MSYTFLSSVQASSPDGNAVTTADFDSTGASLFVAGMAWYQVFDPSGTISDSKGNIWHPLTSQKPAPIDVTGRLWWCIPTSTGTGHSITFGSSFTYVNGGMLMFSGSDPTAPFDTENGADTSSGATTTLQTGTVTPAEDGELFVALLAFGSAGNTVSIDQSFIKQVDLDGLTLSYLIQTTAIDRDPTYTISVSQHMAACIGVFKPDSGGGGGGGTLDETYWAVLQNINKANRRRRYNAAA